MRENLGKARKTTGKTLFAMAAGFAAISAFADITWSGAVEVPANADVTCSDLSAITSLSIGEGATVRFTTTSPHTFPITGSGTIIKESTAEWRLVTAIENFTGDYMIASGVVTVAAAKVLGKDDGKYNVYVRKGATLALESASSPIVGRHVHIAGSGAESHNGALELPAVAPSGQYLNYIYLDDDATMYVPKNGFFFLRNVLDLGGHRLTVTGAGQPTILANCNVSASGEIYLQVVGTEKPILTLRGSNHGDPSYEITPSDSDPLVLTGDAMVRLWGSLKPVCRPLWVSGTKNTLSHYANTVYAGSGEVNTNHANWVGAIVFTNETGLAELKVVNEVSVSHGPCLFAVGGQISGKGFVNISFNGSVSNRIAILNANNAYTGGTSINNGNDIRSTILGYPGSVPNEDFASVTSNWGFVDLAVGDDCSRWSYDAALRFKNACTFQNSCRPRFTGELASDGIGSMKFMVNADTPTGAYLESKGTVCFEGAGNGTPIPFSWYGGTARFTGPQPFLVGDVLLMNGVSDGEESSMVLDGADVTLYETNTLFVGQRQSERTRLVVTNSVLRTSDVLKTDFFSGYDNPDWGGPTRGGAIFAGLYSPGILEVLQGAVITNRIIVSGFNPANSGDGDKQGAVYQRGGHVVALGATKGHHTSCVGLSSGANSCGYYELSGGTLELRGRFVIGGYSFGCFAQYGGTVIATNELSAAPTTRQQNLLMATSNGGSGMLYIKKGSWDIFANDLYFGQGTTTLPTADLTLDGDEAFFDLHDKPIYVADKSSCGVYTFNLNGGVLRCGGIRLNKNNKIEPSGNANNLTNNVLCVNFNGGTFKTGSYNRNLFGYYTDYRDLWSTNVVVYSGGATIDTAGQNGNRINSAVQGAWGKGVKSITMGNPPRGVDYVGALRVRINGDGMGATAFAHFDSTNMVVDRIIVTSPGYGYTTASATVYYGKNVLDADCTVELADNENNGSFKKMGTGDLTLNATNTWGGATVVAGGTLKAGCDWAVPTNSAVRLGGGGVLNLNGKAARISAIEYTAGGGSIVNASAAELPSVPSLRISLDDIRQGQAITFTGDQDFSASTLTVEGADYSWLDDGVRSYNVLTVSGGILGAPALNVETDPPPAWHFIVRSDAVLLRKIKGGMMVIR